MTNTSVDVVDDTEVRKAIIGVLGGRCLFMDALSDVYSQDLTEWLPNDEKRNI